MSGTPMPKMTVVSRGTEDGIAWVTCEAPLYGAVNGYVRLPAGHPWRGVSTSDIDVDVHGGLTFSNDEWIGFDALHGGDVWPEMETDRIAPHTFDPKWDRRWTPEMVATETRTLARQVAAAKPGDGSVKCWNCGQIIPPKVEAGA
jgi:hypothetical protein